MGWWKADPQRTETASSTSTASKLPPPSSSVTAGPSSNTSGSSTSTSIDINTDSNNNVTDTPPSSCPVGPQAREIWLRQSIAGQRQTRTPPPPKDGIEPSSAFASSPTAQCSSDTISQSPGPNLSQPGTRPTSKHTQSLSHDRVVSSIPRAFPHSNDTALPVDSTPSNSESETGPHTSGNWIYPSQHQFFTAVLRKHDPNTILSSPPSSNNPTPRSTTPKHPRPNTTDEASTEALAATMPTIIPIHNAVNERAWSEIRTWENPYNNPPPNPTTTQLPCTGPRLLSFRGLGSGPSPSHPDSGLQGLLSDYLSLLNPTTPLTPRARWNALLGYQIPFDRHDWTVKRCDGNEVDYVIDFYQGGRRRTTTTTTTTAVASGGGGLSGAGRATGTGTGAAGKATVSAQSNLNFYLDVRPKLNSWEGCKTRFLAGWRRFGD